MKNLVARSQNNWPQASIDIVGLLGSKRTIAADYLLLSLVTTVEAIELPLGGTFDSFKSR